MGIPGDVQLGVRAYYRLEPGTGADEQAATHRAVLEVLRPAVSTLWVDATPPGGGWPEALRREGDRLDGLRAARQEAVAASASAAQSASSDPADPADPSDSAEPSGPAERVALDARDDDAFELALAVAAVVPGVRAVGRNGKLVIDADADGIGLWLTTPERDELLQRLRTVGIPATRLAVCRPARVSRSESLRRTQRLPVLLALGWVLMLGPDAIARGLAGLHHAGLGLATLFSVVWLAAGVGMTAYAVDTLVRACLSWWWRSTGRGGQHAARGPRDDPAGARSRVSGSSGSGRSGSLRSGAAPASAARGADGDDGAGR